MEKINFVNGQSPYISATNLKNLQDTETYICVTYTKTTD